MKKYYLATFVIRVKIIQDGEIISGFTVVFKSKFAQEKWLPLRALITVQTKENLKQTFMRLYKFRNIQLNWDVERIKH